MAAKPISKMASKLKTMRDVSKSRRDNGVKRQPKLRKKIPGWNRWQKRQGGIMGDEA